MKEIFEMLYDELFTEDKHICKMFVDEHKFFYVAFLFRMLSEETCKNSWYAHYYVINKSSGEIDSKDGIISMGKQK